MTRTRRRRAGATLTLILLWLATACSGPPDPPADAPSPSTSSVTTPAATTPTPSAGATATQTPGPVAQTPADELMPFPRRPLPMPSPSPAFNEFTDEVVLPYYNEAGNAVDPAAEQRLRENMPINYTGRSLTGTDAVAYARSVAMEIPQAAGTFGAVPAVAECLGKHAVPAAKAFVDDERRGAVVVVIAEFASHTLPGALPHCFTWQVYPGGMDGVCLERYQYDVGPDDAPRSQWAMVIGTGPEYCSWAKRFHSQYSPEDLNL